MEVTADPAWVSDNLRWSCGSIQTQLQNPVNWVYNSNSRGNQPRTTLRCLSFPPVIKVPTFMNTVFPLSNLWRVNYWQRSLRLSKLKWQRCCSLCWSSAAVRDNCKAGFPSWNHWERRSPFLCLCCYHGCHHKSKCPSSLSRIIIAAGSNVSTSVTAGDNMTI